MKEIKIGEQEIRVRATPLALLFYKQEFKRDLLGDVVKLGVLEKDPTQLDSVALLQMIWAMSKADAGVTAQFPSFVEWVGALDSFDLSDQEMLASVMDEIQNGFFRSRAAGVAPAARAQRR